jgi:hypothetical protein
LIAGPCRKSPWNVSNVDYIASATENVTPNALDFSISFLSGSTANRMTLNTVAVPNLVNTWFHFAFSFDGKTSGAPATSNSIKVYINGERVAVSSFGSFGAGFDSYDTDTAIQYGISSGYSFAKNSSVTGSIGEISFFNRELNSDELKKQCFRSHYCVNSLMSNSLKTMISTSSGKAKRFDDLEDFYFREMLNIFNQMVAILVLFGIVIMKMFSAKTSNPTVKPSIPTINKPNQ